VRIASLHFDFVANFQSLSVMTASLQPTGLMIRDAEPC
jgi:hypothetical protein